LLYAPDAEQPNDAKDSHVKDHLDLEHDLRALCQLVKPSGRILAALVLVKILHNAYHLTSLNVRFVQTRDTCLIRCKVYKMHRETQTPTVEPSYDALLPLVYITLPVMLPEHWVRT
jgi:hypothetical protein